MIAWWETLDTVQRVFALIAIYLLLLLLFIFKVKGRKKVK